MWRQSIVRRESVCWMVEVVTGVEVRRLSWSDSPVWKGESTKGGVDTMITAPRWDSLMCNTLSITVNMRAKIMMRMPMANMCIRWELGPSCSVTLITHNCEALKDYCTEKLCSVVWIPNIHLLQIWKNSEKCLQLANLWRTSSVVCIDSLQLWLFANCPNIQYPSDIKLNRHFFMLALRENC